MATFSQNQVKDIFVTSAVAAETTAKTFNASASALEVAVLKADGSAAPAAGEDFYFIQKHTDGSIKTSDTLLGGKVRYANLVNPKTAVLKSYAITVPAAAIVVGDILQLTIVLDNWGSRSFEDQYFKYATYKVVTGDTVTTIAAGLVTSLTNNFSREPGTLFTFSSNAGVITITEVAQDYVTGKKQGLPLEFVISNDFAGTQVVTQRVVDPGSGKNVRDLEYFYKGNVGDSYRGMGYPHNFEEWYDSVLTNQYYLVDIGYYWDGLNHAVQKSEKQILVACSDLTAANAIVDLLETATGLTIGTFVDPAATTTA